MRKHNISIIITILAISAWTRDFNPSLPVIFHDIDAYNLPKPFSPVEIREKLGFCCSALPDEDYGAALCAGNKEGMVMSTLGADRKMRHNPSTPCQALNVEDWFNNSTTTVVQDKLQDQSMKPTDFKYTNENFFLLDNQTNATFYLHNSGSGFNTTLHQNTIRGIPWSSGKYHNNLFCMEAHAYFEYAPGEKFRIKGDDDVWVFVNNKLEIDLGGILTPSKTREATIDLADKGLRIGQTYSIDIFYCDRHTKEASIEIEADFELLTQPKPRVELVKLK